MSVLWVPLQKTVSGIVDLHREHGKTSQLIFESVSASTAEIHSLTRTIARLEEKLDAKVASIADLHATVAAMAAQLAAMRDKISYSTAHAPAGTGTDQSVPHLTGLHDGPAPSAPPPCARILIGDFLQAA